MNIFLIFACFFHDPTNVAIWSWVPFPFLKPTWTSDSSESIKFCRCFWMTFNKILLAWDIRVIMWKFEHSWTSFFFGNGMSSSSLMATGQLSKFLDTGQWALLLALLEKFSRDSINPSYLSAWQLFQGPLNFFLRNARLLATIFSALVSWCWLLFVYRSSVYSCHLALIFCSPSSFPLIVPFPVLNGLRIFFTCTKRHPVWPFWLISSIS